jgi:hypothetical protein
MTALLSATSAPAPLRASRTACALAAMSAACGSSSQAPPPGPVPAPIVIPTPPRTTADLEVARVNGHPVWASCVEAQAGALAGAGPPTPRRAAALDQCVAFELLAQAAEARGLAAGPEVAAATEAAMVNRLVETDFEQRYRTPADLAGSADAIAVMKRNAWRMHIVQLRASTFARFVVPTGAPAEADAQAHALADQLAAELAGQTGLYGVHLTEAAARIAAGRAIKLETSDVKPMHQDDLVAPYARALYGIPAIGEASPAVRTQWGWDVVVWTGGVEPLERTRDELFAEIFPELRRHEFQRWVTQIIKQLGVHIEVDQASVARLDDASDDAAPGPAVPAAAPGPGRVPAAAQPTGGAR